MIERTKVSPQDILSPEETARGIAELEKIANHPHTNFEEKEIRSADTVLEAVAGNRHPNMLLFITDHAGTIHVMEIADPLAGSWDPKHKPYGALDERTAVGADANLVIAEMFDLRRPDDTSGHVGNVIAVARNIYPYDSDGSDALAVGFVCADVITTIDPKVISTIRSIQSPR